MTTITTTTIDMQIELQKITDKEQLDSITVLYVTSFPPAERREPDELEHLLHAGDCAMFRILTQGDTQAGFCMVWNFPGFVFFEHFAIEPDLRGLGIGEKTLSEIKALYQKTVILETELPYDEISSRRIRFYERNGFHKLKRTYFQPPYGTGKSEIELKLMSTTVDFSAELLDEMINSIRKKVYGIKSLNH